MGNLHTQEVSLNSWLHSPVALTWGGARWFLLLFGERERVGYNCKTCSKIKKNICKYWNISKFRISTIKKPKAIVNFVPFIDLS